MPSIEEFRAKYPNAASLSDRDIIKGISDELGTTEEYTANLYGVKKNTAGFATDTVVDGARGLLSIPKAVTGIGNLVTGGAVGRGLKATFGGDLEDVDKKLTGYYSNNRQDAQADVDGAHGFVDSAKAYLRHPGLLAGEAIQGVAGMVLPVGMAGKVGSVVEKQLALRAAELGKTGAEAATFIADGVKASLANKLAAPAAFGVTSAGQAADESIHNDPNNMGAMYGSAAGAGVANAAGMHISSLLPGGGAAQSFATKGILGQLDGNVASRTGVAMANQAGTMAGINAGSTISGNVANDRPWEQGVPESMVSGGMGGALFGAAHGLTHGKMKANADGEITIGDKTLAPDQVPGHIEQLDTAAQEQQTAAQTQASQQELGRNAMAAKYGVKDHTYVGADGTEVKDGFDFIGKHLTSQDALNKALDTLAARESSTKKPGQLQGEIALTNVLRARGVENLNPSSIYKADGSITDARSIVLDADDEHAVLGRVNKRIADETTAQVKATANLEKAQGRLDTAKAALDQTGMDTTVDSATKAVETNKQKLEDSQKRLGFYNDWAKALQDHTGAKNGEVPSSTNEGPNGRDQTLSKDGESPHAGSIDGANNENSKAPDNQRPELNVVEKQPDQKAEVAPVAAPEVKAPIVAEVPKPVEAPVVAKVPEPVAAPVVAEPVKKLPTLAPKERVSEAASAGVRLPEAPVMERSGKRKVVEPTPVDMQSNRVAGEVTNLKGESVAIHDLVQHAAELSDNGTVRNTEDMATKLGISNEAYGKMRDTVLRSEKPVEASADGVGQLIDGIADKTLQRDIKIYSDYIVNEANQREVAKKYGVSQKTVSTIGIPGKLAARLEAAGISKENAVAMLRGKEGEVKEHLTDHGVEQHLEESIHKESSTEALDEHAEVGKETAQTLEDGEVSRKGGIDSDETVNDDTGTIDKTLNGSGIVDTAGGSQGAVKGFGRVGNAYFSKLEHLRALEESTPNSEGLHKIEKESKLYTHADREAAIEHAQIEHDLLSKHYEVSVANTAKMKGRAQDELRALEATHKDIAASIRRQIDGKTSAHDDATPKSIGGNMKRPDGSDYSTDHREFMAQHKEDLVTKMQAAKDTAKKEELDGKLAAYVKEHFDPALEAAGITKASEGLSRITGFITRVLPHLQEGQLEHYIDTDGIRKYTVVLSADVVERNDPAVIHRILQHETFHAIDMSPDGGIYSSQPEVKFMKTTDGEMRAVGPVARELLDHFNNKGIFAEELDYPLSKDAGLTSGQTAKEVLAQAWHIYQNPILRAHFEAHLPVTAKYLSEVVQHVKDTPAAIHGSTASDSQRLSRDFGRRATGAYDYASAAKGRSEIQRHSTDVQGPARRVLQDDTRSAGSRNNPTQFDQSRARSVPDASNVTPAVKRDLLEENVLRLKPALQAPVRSIAKNIEHFATSGLQSSAFLHDLADWGAKLGLHAMKTVNRLMAEKGALKSTLDKELGAVAQMYDDLQPRAWDRLTKGASKDQVAVGTYLRDAQFAHGRQWGYTPEWKIAHLDETERKAWIDKHVAGKDAEGNPALATKDWEKLSPAAQKVVDAILKRNSEMRGRTQAEMDAHITAMFAERVADAGGDKAAIEKINAERDKMLRDVQMRDGEHAYSPIKRFGNHVVTVQSKELAELRKDYTLNRKDIAVKQNDPDHYQVMHFDTAGEAANKAVAMRAEFGDSHNVQASEKTELLKHGTHAYEALQNMAEAASRGADKEFSTAINNAMTHAIIKSMGEQTSRTSALHRKLISGVEPEEMIRAFVTNGYSDNAMLSSVLHNRKISDAMKELDTQVHTGSDKDRPAKTRLYNEVQLRRNNSAKMHDPAPWVSHAMRFTSTWKLITSPAYYLQYLSQPLTMAAPVLQGRHGYAEGMKAIYHGIRDSHNMMDVINGKKKLGGVEGANITDMLNSLQKTGTISIGHSEQFGRYHNRPEGSLSREWVRATDKLSQLPHTVEMHNRVGTAVGAYKLEYAKAMKVEGTTNAAAHAQATEYARSVINTAYGDYSSYNAPRIMTGGPLRKLAFQYRQFQAIHGAMLVRAMNQAFSSEHPDVRKAAKLQMGFMAAHYGVLAGALGIPGAHVVASALQQVFGDSDGPENTDLFIKRHVGDGAFGRMVTEGLPGLAGMKLSNRMGAGDIFSPFRGDTPLVPTTKKEYSDYALAVAGPFLGAMVPQVIDGVGRIGKGDYYRGLEQLMPKGIGDVMKATRFANEGVSNRKGDTTLSADALGAGDIASQAFGAAPLKVADAQAAQNNVYKFEQHFKDKVNELSEAYTRNKDLAAVRPKWEAMQAAQKREGFKPTPLQTLLAAPMRQAKRERATIGGVEYNKNNKSFVQSMIGGEE